MKLDFKNFKKIECDDKCTTLQHPQGHTIKIAHSKLSPEMRSELDELPLHAAKGGKIAPKNSGNSKTSENSKAQKGNFPRPKQAAHNYTEPNAMGTSIPKGMLQSAMNEKHYPDVVLNALNRKAPPNGPLGSEPKQHYPPCINPSCKSYGSSHPNCKCYSNAAVAEAGYFADGGEVDSYCSKDNPHKEGCEYFADGGMPNKMFEEESAPTEEIPVTQEEQNFSPAPPLASMPEEVPVKSQEGLAPVEVVKEEVPVPAPETTEVDLQEPNPEPTPQRQPAATPVDNYQMSKQAESTEMQNEAQAFYNDLDQGHIKPKTYQDLFADKSTLGKIGTIFGMIIGGAGAGLAGQTNMLLDMMNKQIENDLQAQQKSVENKQNFMKINQQNILTQAQATGINVEADVKANALARIQMNYAALHKLVQDTRKIPEGTPQRQQADQALALISTKINEQNFNIADMAASQAAAMRLLGGGGAGADTTVLKSGLLGPEMQNMGKDIEDKVIPGIPGKATRPIAPADRAEVNAMNILDQKAADVLSFAKKHKGSIDPKIIALGAQKAHELMNFYNNSIQGGVLTQGRMEWLDKQVKKNPTSIFQDVLGNNLKLEEIKNSNAVRRDSLLKSYGFKTPKLKTPSSTSSSGIADGKTAVNAQGQKIIMKNGKWVRQ